MRTTQISPASATTRFRRDSAGSLKRAGRVLALSVLVVACSADPPEGDLLDRAEQALHKGDVRSAVIDAKTVLQQSPDNPIGRRLLGEAYLYRQEAAAAVSEFERALMAAGDEPAILLPYARALVAAEQWQELLGFHREDRFAAVAGDPRYLAALAMARSAVGDREGARAAIAQGGDHPRIQLARALLLLQAEGDTEGAQAILEEVVAAEPGFVEAWSLLGNVTHVRGAYDRAAKAYSRAVDLNSYRFADRLNLVSVQLELGELEAVQRQLDHLEKTVPDDPGIAYARGRLLMQKGEDAGALDAFSRALAAEPGHPGALFSSAVLNARQGHLATARSRLERFLAIRPGDINGRLQLASVLFRTKVYGEAADMARAVLEREGDNRMALGILGAALGAREEHVASADVYRRLVELEPDRVAALLGLGDQLLAAGEPSASLEVLLSARDKAPASAGVRESLIRAYLALGDRAAARAQAAEYMNRQPADPQGHLWLAHIALSGEDYTEAKRHFEQVLAREPGHLVASKGLAALAASEQNLDEARRRYQQALAHHPADTGTLMQLAVLEAESGDAGAMAGALETAVSSDAEALDPRLSLARLRLQQGRSGEAVQLLAELRDKYPDDPRLWRLLARAWVAAGDLEAAIEAGEHLLTLVPEDAPAQAMMGQMQLRALQFVDAQRHLAKALELAPDNTDVRKLMADALLGQGKLAEADEVLAKLPEAAASEPAVRVARGRIALGQQRYADAEGHLRAAMAQRPESRTLLWLSGALAARGEEKKAMALLVNWLEANPEDALVRHQLAVVHLGAGREVQAREQFLKVLEVAPDNAMILNNLAWLYRTEDPQRALGYIEKAQRLAPDSAQIKDTYAIIQLQRGALEEALSLNQRALALAPENPDILFHRARILEAAGDREEAVRVLESLVASEGFRRKDEARAMLGKLRAAL